jgi:hypothetical protein
LAGSFDAKQAVGEIDVPLPGLLPPGQVLWVQPVLYARDGKPSWAAASAHVIVPAPEAKPAVLARKPAPDKQPLRLKLGAQGDEWGWTFTHTSTLSMVEEAKDAAADRQNYRLSLDRGDLDFVENGRSSPITLQELKVLDQLKSAAIDLQTDARGNVVRATADLNKVPAGDARKSMDKYLEHIRLGLETLAVPVPEGDGRAEPGQRWQATRPLPIGPFDTIYAARFDMIYAFRGVRAENGREVAVLALSGILKPRRVKDREISATATGEAIVDLATGQTVRVQCTLEVVHRVRTQNVVLPLSHRTLELTLTRGPNSR